MNAPASFFWPKKQVFAPSLEGRSAKKNSLPAASFQYASSNQKLAPIGSVPYTAKNPAGARFKFRPTPRAPFCCSTYSSIRATCSDRCPYKKDALGQPGGCFIEAEHFTRKLMAQLDARAVGKKPIDIVREEVALIDSAFTRGKYRSGVPQDGARGGRDLRIHVGGDVPTEEGARLLAGAAARWVARGGGRVWSYTHTWRSIPADAFWPISILASLEKPHQIAQARAKGYAPALTVDRFPNGKLPFVVAGTRFIPCPAETVGKTCVECRLCLDADLVGMKSGIAFQIHGDHAAIAKSALVQLGRGRSAA